MQVTLKKAAALASTLAAIKVDMPTTIRLSVYSEKDIAEEVEQAYAAIDTAVANALAITEGVYVIRGLIGQANEGEINSLLTSRAAIDKQLAILNTVVNTAKPLDYVALAAQRKSLANQTENMYGGIKTLEITIPTVDLAPAQKQLKKKRIQIEDKLSQLNFTKTIELPDDVVALLTEHDLV